MLGAFQETLEGWLRTERLLPKAQRRTARRLFEGLQAKGYRGAYDSVQDRVRQGGGNCGAVIAPLLQAAIFGGAAGSSARPAIVSRLI